MPYSTDRDPELEKIQDVVVEAVAPDRIILFGSRARGQSASNSDYDLLVIKDDVQNEREVARKINYRLLHEDIERTVDIIVASTDTWNRNARKIGTIYKRIAEEGVTLYG